MHPFADPPYDRATAWDRMDESESTHVLQVIEDRFNQRLIRALDEAVDEAHVRLAKQGMSIEFTHEGGEPAVEQTNQEGGHVAVSDSPASATQRTENAESNSTDRRATVDAYIEEVFRAKGKRITKKEFWEAAGYRTRTEFERWKRRDPKHTNKSADQNFSRILREKPHLK